MRRPQTIRIRQPAIILLCLVAIANDLTSERKALEIRAQSLKDICSIRSILCQRKEGGEREGLHGGGKISTLLLGSLAGPKD